MILVCPSCDTRYFADDTAVGKDGRRVRCASCGHSWFAKVQEEGAPAPAENTGLTREQVERLRQTAAANSAARAGPHAEFRAREHARRKRDRSRAAMIAWVASFAVFAGAAGASVLYRNEISEAFPKAASLYRMVGLDVNRYGLALQDVEPKRSFDGTTPVVTVTGSVVNDSEQRQDTPLIRIILRDEGGKKVHEWTDKLTVDALGPGERVEFSSRSEAPPIEAFKLTVTFAPKPGQKLDGSQSTVETAEGHAIPAPPKPAAKADDHEGDAPKVLHEGDEGYQEPGWSGGDGGGEAGETHAEPVKVEAADH